MHAVIPYSEETRQTSQYILCHILEIKKRGEYEKVEACFTETGQPHFYKLFAFLHNFNMEHKWLFFPIDIHRYHQSYISIYIISYQITA